MAFNRGVHGCAGDCGGANGHFGPVVDEKDPVKADLGAFIILETVHIEPLILLNLVLVPCNFYDGVHDETSVFKGVRRYVISSAVENSRSIACPQGTERRGFLAIHTPCNASQMPKASGCSATTCGHPRWVRASDVRCPMATTREGAGAVQCWTLEGDVKHTTSAAGDA